MEIRRYRARPRLPRPHLRPLRGHIGGILHGRAASHRGVTKDNKMCTVVVTIVVRRLRRHSCKGHSKK